MALLQPSVYSQTLSWSSSILMATSTNWGVPWPVWRYHLSTWALACPIAFSKMDVPDNPGDPLTWCPPTGQGRHYPAHFSLWTQLLGPSIVPMSPHWWTRLLLESKDLSSTWSRCTIKLVLGKCPPEKSPNFCQIGSHISGFRKVGRQPHRSPVSYRASLAMYSSPPGGKPSHPLE